MVAQIIENRIINILLDEHVWLQGYEEMRQDKKCIISEIKFNKNNLQV